MMLNGFFLEKRSCNIIIGTFENDKFLNDEEVSNLFGELKVVSKRAIGCDMNIGGRLF